ncbi:hypothetical protein CERZMDRAFT_90926 [Cercospora zeae-maydis SCOH1-5]|uniref:Uncharacterized protein n=1 Tax=Cercospora zeae-maydis SCOH1-5 TaxID=717836 RepID=A0A6A6FDM3_9PEZI|nr:hypothetical protein CERZMDRAFT_90926 [Cercospora zeae-maydis SCOH1-5]
MFSVANDPLASRIIALVPVRTQLRQAVVPLDPHRRIHRIRVGLQSDDRVKRPKISVRTVLDRLRCQ